MLQTATYTAPGGRPENEDYARFTGGGDRLLAVLCDGLGGHGGGALAAKTAAQTISGGWTQTASAPELEQLVQRAHQAVTALQTAQCAMKTTAVALALADGRAAWAHVGDSRLYHFYNGALVFQTTDHSVSQIAVMLGEITAGQIRHHADRSRLLRALGQDGPLRVEAREEPLLPGRHAFLLCSDGFWEDVLEQEMAGDLSLARSAEDWLCRMRRRLDARAGADHDNNTASAIWLER